MLRFTPPGFQRLEQAQSFEVHVGGTESNTAVGLARLGLKVAWLSRLSDNPLGKYIARAIAQHGVDTSQVVWTPEDRVGTYFLERGKAPRGSQVIYDRKHSAVSKMRPEDLPESLFQTGSARLFHTTGITLGIGESAAATALHAVKLAKAAGWLISFDLNYRAKLWSAAAARAGCHEILKLTDIFFLPRRDARTVYGIQAEKLDDALSELAQHYPQALIVMTLGAEGAAARAPTGEVYNQPAFFAEEVERLGGGDAFSAGFLYGYLESDIALALRWGTAVAALKYGILGDFPLIEKAEAEALVQGQKGSSLAR
jgi:2-dehydro-3-deoxygluconokinase